MTLSAGMGEEVRANGLDIALGGSSKSANGLEVLVGSPTCGQDGEREVDLNGRHDEQVCWKVDSWRRENVRE